MFRFLIILFLIIYLFFKFGQFLFKVFFLGNSQQARTNFDNRRRTSQPPGSNVNIEYAPDPKGGKREGHLKGGDYVDYEELK